MDLQLFIVILSAYLVGSISFSVLIGKLLKGIDIRDYGSGNAGTTNTLRVLGKGPAVLVLVGDALKGIASVAIGLYFGNINYAVLAGLAAILGHTYPVFFGFKGGRGVATGLGVIIMLTPYVSLIALGIFITIVITTRYVSLGSILGALSVPINMYIFHKPFPVFLLGIIAASFVIIRHRVNMVRLFQGKENKIKFNKEKEVQ